MNVLIGQCDSFQGHKHLIEYPRSNDGAGRDGHYIGNGYLKGYTWYADNITESGYGTPRVANETRSKNMTVVLWKRIS